MLSEENMLLEFNQCVKYNEEPSLIYVVLESLIKKISGCKSNLRKSSTAKLDEHLPCSYSVFTAWTFEDIEKKHNLCKSKDCMKKKQFSNTYKFSNINLFYWCEKVFTHTNTWMIGKKSTKQCN